MQNNRFKGTGVALVTPFDKNKNVDFDALGKLVEHVIRNGVNYLVVSGTTAETATLSKEEKAEVVEYIKEKNNKRVPFILGMGGNNTYELSKSISTTDFNGIDAILSVSPYYNKPTQKGIFEHYSVIANESPLPVIIYNVPGRTASNISADTTLKLAEKFHNIIGTKEASGDLAQIMKIIKYKPKDFLVLSGDDLLTLPMIACGGDGVISVVANAFPKDFAAMVSCALKADFSKAKELHYKLTDIINYLFVEGNPGGVKAALEILGITPNNLRLPLVSVGEETYNKLSTLIKNY